MGQLNIFLVPHVRRNIAYSAVLSAFSGWVLIASSIHGLAQGQLVCKPSVSIETESCGARPIWAIAGQDIRLKFCRRIIPRCGR
jgi:hypothetical protein